MFSPMRVIQAEKGNRERNIRGTYDKKKRQMDEETINLTPGLITMCPGRLKKLRANCR